MTASSAHLQSKWKTFAKSNVKCIQNCRCLYMIQGLKGNRVALECKFGAVGCNAIFDIRKSVMQNVR